jgi:sortase A
VRRRLAALATAVGLLVGATACGAASRQGGTDLGVDVPASTTTSPPIPDATHQPYDDPAAAVTTTTDPAAPATTAAATTTTEPLPQPIDSPTDVYGAEPEIRLGTIEIPRIGLQTTLYQGIRLTTIDRGPGHWPGTAMPGQRGNVVVAGHRVTHSHPFRDLDRLVPGDVAVFTVDGVAWTYVVVSDEVVDPTTGMRIVAQTPDYTATLFACHPPGSAAQRYVVHLRLQDPPPTPSGGGDPTPPQAPI